MEKVAIGSIVRSLRGRDRKRIFLITGICEGVSDRVLIADGELHPLSKPKRKNLSHLAVLAAAEGAGTSFFEGDDKELCEFLREFEAGQNKK